jgi:hypothetical protein
MEYPNSGSLWPAKERKSDKAPNLRGSIKMDPQLLQEMINQSNGELVEIEIGAWTKEYNDKKFLSLKAGMPYKKENKAPRPSNDDDQDIPF